MRRKGLNDTPSHYYADYRLKGSTHDLACGCKKPGTRLREGPHTIRRASPIKDIDYFKRYKHHSFVGR